MEESRRCKAFLLSVSWNAWFSQQQQLKGEDVVLEASSEDHCIFFQQTRGVNLRQNLILIIICLSNDKRIFSYFYWLNFYQSAFQVSFLLSGLFWMEKLAHSSIIFHMSGIFYQRSSCTSILSLPAVWRRTQVDNLDKFVTGLQRDFWPQVIEEKWKNWQELSS